MSERIHQLAPASLAHLRPVGAFKESSLVGNDQVCSRFRRQKFEGDLCGGDAASTEGHQARLDNAFAWHDVLKDAQADDRCAGKRRVLAELVLQPLRTSHLKIHLKGVHRMIAVLTEPALLLSRI